MSLGGGAQDTMSEMSESSVDEENSDAKSAANGSEGGRRAPWESAASDDGMTAAGNPERRELDDDEDDDSGGEDGLEEEEEEDDYDDFADGPAEWADVDEAELQQAVMQLYHLSTAPTADTVARTVSLQLAEHDYVDPLGMGRIDTRTMGLVSAGGHRRGGAAPANAQKQNRRGRAKRQESVTKLARHTREKAHSDRPKILPTSEKFDPETYLSLVHSETPLRNLHGGVAALQQGVTERKRQLQDLVKDNFERFIGCKNSLDDVHSRLIASQGADDEDTEDGVLVGGAAAAAAGPHQGGSASASGSGGVSTDELHRRVKAVMGEAHLRFDPLVERHQQVERMRNVVGLLRRFSLMFSLPARIRQHADADDHEAILGEYKKAKQIVGRSKTSIWSSLMKEIVRMVEGVVDDLVMKLVTPSTPPEEAVEAIGNLLMYREEHAPGTSGDRLSDPVKIYMDEQQQHFLDRLDDLSIEHSCSMTNLREKVQEQAQQDARWMQLQKDSFNESRTNMNLAVDDTEIQGSFSRVPSDYLSLVYGDQENIDLWETVELEGVKLLAPQAAQVRFETRLTGMMARQLAEFWMAFSGRRDRGSPSLAAEIRSKGGDLAKVIKAVCKVYRNLMQQLLEDMGAGLADAMPGLMMVTKHLAKACVQLQGSGASSLSSNVADMGWASTLLCVSQLCASLHCPAPWLVDQESFEAMPLSCYTDSDPISPMPVALATRLATATDSLAEIAAVSAAFPPSSSAKLQQEREQQMEAQLSEAFYGCISSCCDALQKLAARLSSASSSESSGLSAGGGNAKGADGSDEHEAPRLLLLRNNAAFVRGHLLPGAAAELLGHLQALQPGASLETAVNSNPFAEADHRQKTATQSHHLAPDSEAFSSAMLELQHLGDEFLSTYSGMKESALSDLVDRYLAGLDKGGAQFAPPPSGVREPAIEVVNALAAVFAEALTASPSQAGRVISKLGAKVVAAIYNLIAALQGPVCRAAAVQLVLEVEFLEAAVSKPLQVCGSTTAVSGRAVAATIKKIQRAAAGGGGGGEEDEDPADGVVDEAVAMLPAELQRVSFNASFLRAARQHKS